MRFGPENHARLHDVAGAVDSLPDPFEGDDRPQALKATGTDPLTNNLSVPCQWMGDVSGRYESHPDAITGQDAHVVTMTETPEKQDSGRMVTSRVVSGQEARPVGFEPTTFGFEVRDSIR